MEVWKHQPASASRLGHAQSIRSMNMGMRMPRPGSIKSHARSTFYATIAERQEAEEEAKLMRQDYENDVRGGRGAGSSGPKGSRAWFGRKRGHVVEEVDEKRTSTKKGGKLGNKSKQQVTMVEFDLEKLGYYQSGDRKGEELPVLTRSASSFLVTGLKLLV
ncbi:hypothetical protein LTR06_011222, partial [Exophiala xenobiotica]